MLNRAAVQTSCKQENVAQLLEAGAAKLLRVGEMKLAVAEEDHASDAVEAAAEYGVVWWGRH